jgi:hypothetical protein
MLVVVVGERFVLTGGQLVAELVVAVMEVRAQPAMVEPILVEVEVEVDTVMATDQWEAPVGRVL